MRRQLTCKIINAKSYIVQDTTENKKIAKENVSSQNTVSRQAKQNNKRRKQSRFTKNKPISSPMEQQ